MVDATIKQFSGLFRQPAEALRTVCCADILAEKLLPPEVNAFVYAKN